MEVVVLLFKVTLLEVEVVVELQHQVVVVVQVLVVLEVLVLQVQLMEHLQHELVVEVVVEDNL